MEREQRSEGLLRDFIRANCQRMKHELAKRDCGLGQYRRDPRSSSRRYTAAASQPKCEADTHYHTRTATRRPPLLADTQSVTIDQPKAGERGG